MCIFQMLKFTKHADKHLTDLDSYTLQSKISDQTSDLPNMFIDHVSTAKSRIYPGLLLSLSIFLIHRTKCVLIQEIYILLLTFLCANKKSTSLFFTLIHWKSPRGIVTFAPLEETLQSQVGRSWEICNCWFKQNWCDPLPGSGLTVVHPSSAFGN